jgi:hypothetical protein
MNNVTVPFLKYYYAIPDLLLTTQSSSKVGIAALISDGGGAGHRGYYDPADLAAFFVANSLARPPFVNYTDVSPSPKANDPTDPDGETQLDIQFISGMSAGAASAHIYHSTSGFYPVLQAVLADPHPPSVLSISYGVAEALVITDLPAMTFIDAQFMVLGLRVSHMSPSR